MATGNWQGMVENITAKGMLAKRMYVVFTTPTGGMDAVMKNLEEHLAYQVDLEARGIMFGAGPFANDAEADWEGEGMVIVRAASLHEARAIAEADPMHKSGARKFRIRPWLLNEGSYTVTVRYSQQYRAIA
jgi:hypothetical protein